MANEALKMTDDRRYIDLVRTYAGTIHGDQMYGDMPFFFHLLNVEYTLRTHGVTDPVILAAGLLHDAIEDTSVTREKLTDYFGQEIADLVWRVTDEDGVNRKERKAQTYVKIAGDERAIAIKFADRISNIKCAMEEAEYNPDKRSLVKMYYEEHEGFMDALGSLSFRVEGLNALWESIMELDEKLDDYAAVWGWRRRR